MINNNNKYVADFYVNKGSATMKLIKTLKLVDLSYLLSR